MKHARLARQSGMTLIEVLVSLAILAVIVTAITSGLHFGRRVWERPTAIERREEAEAAMSALAALLERTYPARVADTRQLGALVFSGAPDHLIFVALSEGETQYGGLTMVQLSVDPERNALLIQSQIFRPQPVGDVAKETKTSTGAIENVAAIEIRYFGATPGSPGDSWQSTWAERDALPKLISLRLVAKGGNWPSVPAVVVGIRMS